MFRSFRFYRRRRVLPFLAVYCLVFVNGATLVPLVLPAAHAEAAAASEVQAGAGLSDSWHRLQYERRRADAETEPGVTAALPPVVKNLRRSPPNRAFRSGSRWIGRQPADSPGKRVGCVPWSPAARAAELIRLCRLLL